MRDCAVVLIVLIAILLVVIPMHADGSSDIFAPDAEPDAVAANAPHTERFQELASRRALSLLVYDLDAETTLAGIDVYKQMPVVSAIKGPVLLYFLQRVESRVWASVPVEHWHAEREDVPARYQSAWEAHRDILRDLYRMIVYSDNVATGNALTYVHRASSPTDLNPIEAFNRWSEDVVGVGPDSGLRSWDQGATDEPGMVDPRFEERTTRIYGVPRFYNNTFSALDLARYYHWLYTQADETIYETAVSLLSIVEGYPGFLEDTALNLKGTPVSKDGFVGPGDDYNAANEYLTADAGLMLLPERALLVVTMAVDGGDRLDAIYAEVGTLVRRDRAEVYWPPDQDFITWMRSADGPLGENQLSTEALYFIMDYLTGLGMRPQQGEPFSGDPSRFREALRVWLAVFPDDTIPEARTPEQRRVLAARYSQTGEPLHVIAADLGLIPSQNVTKSP